MAEHQQQWDAALELEHGHQRELLATLRGELGTFASECASALVALDAFAAGLSGIATIAAQAQQGYAHAKLLHDLARTRPGETAEGRSERELLGRVWSDSSVRAEIESLWGPAPVAVMMALEPLRKWIPTIAGMRRGEKSLRELADQAGKDLVTVLGATESVAGGGAEVLAADAGSLAESFRDSVEHVRNAARAVKDGKLEQVLAESRRLLEADLAGLAGVIDGAGGAAEDWVRDRRSEHGELTKEVHEKLDRVERTRRILGLILPHLQAIARSLATAEKLISLEHRVLPEHVAAAEASRQLMLVDLGSLWDAAIPGVAPPRHKTPRRPRARRTQLLAGGAVVVVAAVVGLVLALSGGGKKNAAGTTTSSTTGAAPAAAASTSKYVCSGNQVYVFNNSNVLGVVNGGTQPTFSTKGKAYCLTSITTYHWNNASGAAPGKLGLKQTSGPSGVAAGVSLQAKASSGSNNAPNVNWYVYVSQTPPTVIDGTYACTDSSPSTWSSNSGTGGAGFCEIQGVPAVKS